MILFLGVTSANSAPLPVWTRLITRYRWQEAFGHGDLDVLHPLSPCKIWPYLRNLELSPDFICLGHWNPSQKASLAIGIPLLTVRKILPPRSLT